MAIKKFLVLLFLMFPLFSYLLLKLNKQNKECFFYYKYPLKKDLFKLKNVKRDLKIEIERNNYKFLCIFGVAMSIPPNITPQNLLVKKYGYKCICVSDIKKSKEIPDLKRIYNYVVKYNSLLLKYLEN